ncbi:MAG: fatty acid desaturase [Pseudomonadota bacterium]
MVTAKHKIDLGAHRASARAGGVSWSLIGIYVSLWCAVAVTSWAALSDYIPLWLGGMGNALFLYFLAQINHEAFHRNVCGKDLRLAWLNDLMGGTVSFAFWFSFPAFKATHLSHHSHLNQDGKDSDMWTSRKGVLPTFLACASLLFKYEADIWAWWREGRLDRSVLIRFYIERAIAIAIVALAFANGYGLEITMLWLLPAVAGLLAIVFLFTYVVHHPHTEMDAIGGTNTVLAAPWLQPIVTFIFAFHNYHIVHHLFPRIPFFRLGTIFREIRPQLVERGAPIMVLGASPSDDARSTSPQSV